MTSLDQRIQDYKIIKAHTTSLLSNIPTGETTPNVWALDKTSPYFGKDSLYIQQNFPSHHVVGINGQIRDR
jgi:hypothetical protein